MTIKFADLIVEAAKGSLDKRKTTLRAELAQMLSESALNHWRKGDKIFGAPERILVGVGNYSVLDLKLLDAFQEMIREKPSNQCQIDVFDVEDLESMDDLQKYIPGIGKTYQTPIIGIWENGSLVKQASGAQGRSMIVERYKLHMPE